MSVTEKQLAANRANATLDAKTGARILLLGRTGKSINNAKRPQDSRRQDEPPSGDDMVSRGAEGTDAEIRTVLDYLVTNLRVDR